MGKDRLQLKCIGATPPTAKTRNRHRWQCQQFVFAPYVEHEMTFFECVFISPSTAKFNVLALWIYFYSKDNLAMKKKMVVVFWHFWNCVTVTVNFKSRKLFFYHFFKPVSSNNHILNDGLIPWMGIKQC